MAFFIQMLLLFSLSASMASQCFKDETNVNAFCHLAANSASAATAVKGEVKMTQLETGGLTYFKINITGLEPNSTHGFHIHTSGDIFTKGCSSAGGHYNPNGLTHGGLTDKIRHTGDLGNVYADNNGEVAAVKTDCMASLIGRTNIIGRSIVLHAKKDDLGKGSDTESKKTGNAGARIACGIIFLV